MNEHHSVRGVVLGSQCDKLCAFIGAASNSCTLHSARVFTTGI